MAIARPKEGPRAPLFYCVLALACGGLAQAQSVDLSELERCAGLDTDEAKLACFEAIVAGTRASVPVAPDSDPQPVPEPVAEAVAARESVPERGPPGHASPEQAAGTSAAQSPAIRAPTAAPAPLPSAAVAPATESNSFGGEYLESVAESRSEEMTATVVDVTKTRHGELVFHLDNGQVWAQTEKRYYPYPREQQFDVMISIGVLGQYQLQVGGAGRKVAVKRLK